MSTVGAEMPKSPWVDIPQRSGLERYHEAIEADPLTLDDVLSENATKATTARFKVLFAYHRIPWRLPVPVYRETFLREEISRDLGEEAANALFKDSLPLLDKMALAQIEAGRLKADQAERDLQPDPGRPIALCIAMAALRDAHKSFQGCAGVKNNTVFEAVAARLGPGIDRGAVMRVQKNKLIPHLHAPDAVVFLMALERLSQVMAEVDARRGVRSSLH